MYEPLTALLANHWTATVSLACVTDLPISLAIGADHALVDGVNVSVINRALCIRFDDHVNLLEDLWWGLLLKLQIAPSGDPTLCSNLRRNCRQAGRVYTLIELEGPVKLEQGHIIAPLVWASDFRVEDPGYDSTPLSPTRH